MKLNKVSLFVLAALTSVLAACDDPKTIEGTVWVNGNAGSPIKMAGIPVTLLPPKVRDAIKSHVGAFGSQIASAQAKAIGDAVAANLVASQAEKTSAQKSLDEASLQLGEAKKRVDAVTVIERREQESYDVAAAPINERLRSLKEAAKPIDAKVEEQKALLAVEQGKNDVAFSEKKSQLQDQFTNTKNNLAREKALLVDLQATMGTRSKELGEELNRRYLREKIKVSTRTETDCSGCQQMCFSIQNTGTKAIRSITPQLFVNGKDVTSSIRDLLSIPSQWAELDPLLVQNEYKEKVEGLPPGRQWPDDKVILGRNSCIWLNGTRGDGKRAWDSLGGLSARTKVEVRIGQVTLADPKKSSSSGSSYSKVWRYSNEPPEAIFASEIETMIDSTAKAQLAVHARAIESGEAAVAQAETNLEGIKPDIATSQLLVDAQAERRGIDLEVEKVVAELATVGVSLQRAKDDKQAQMETLATAEAVHVERRERLQTLDAGILSLTQKKGPQFDAVAEKAKASVSTSEVEKKWYADLIKLLNEGGGITVQSDIDGKYRFEKVTWKSPILFAVSDQRDEANTATPGRRVGPTQRIPPYFWMAFVDTSKTTLVDLGQSSAVRLTANFIPAILTSVSAVSGVPVSTAATDGSQKGTGDSEAICFAAHQAGLLNPESLEIFEFRQVPRDQIDELAKQEREALAMLMDFAKLECRREALPASLPDVLVQSCALTKMGTNTGKYVGVLQTASKLGDAAKLYSFRAKATSRDGRQITHTAVCVVEANGKATVAQSDSK